MMEIQTPVLRIFCAYASQDRAYFEQLEKALAVPIRQQRLALWHHGEITPGTEFDHEIEKQFYQADIILLLISPTFMASDYCSTREMQWALTRQKTGEAIVIPLIVKPTPDWEATFLGSLQVLPAGKKPITLWKRQDEAFAVVVNGLLGVIRQMQREESFPVKQYHLMHCRLSETRLHDFKDALPKCIKTREESRYDRESDLGITTMYEKWFLSKEIDNSIIDVSYNYLFLEDHPFFGSVSITSQKLMYIDHLLQILPLSYNRVRWTLLHELDTNTIVQSIKEQTGKFPHPYSDSDHQLLGTEPLDISYTFSHPDGDGIDVAFKAGQTREICLQATNQQNSSRTFYHAHQLFSPKKLMAMLNGKFSPRHIWQLVDEASTP